MLTNSGECRKHIHLRGGYAGSLGHARVQFIKYSDPDIRNWLSTYRAALRGEYRLYSDSWGIDAFNGEASYTHPLGEHLELDASFRYYDQTQADFYADIFPFQNAQNFLARDKELAAFSSTSIGAGASYTFGNEGFWIFSKGSANLYVDYVLFDYENFSDVTTGAALGEEPLYEFDAIVYRAYLSLWF